MRVKSLMALIALSILALSANADETRVPPSAVAGVRTDYQETTNLFALITNVYKQATGTLSTKDKNTHIKTVVLVASTLETGKIAEWSNPDNGTAGRVMAVMTKPVQGGFCRLLFTQVEKDGNIREYSEYACKTMDSRYWTFYLARE